MAQKTNPKPDAKAVKPKKGAKPAPKATPPEVATPPLASQPAPPSAAPATTTTTKAAQEAKPKKLEGLGQTLPARLRPLLDQRPDRLGLVHRRRFRWWRTTACARSRPAATGGDGCTIDM